MAAKEAFGFGETVLLFLSLIGICIWIGIIWKAEGEDKLVEACSPIDWTISGLHTLTTGLIGREPTWTLHTKRYLMGGCYYFFSVMLRISSDDASGGIRGAAFIPPMHEPVGNFALALRTSTSARGTGLARVTV